MVKRARHCNLVAKQHTRDDPELKDILNLVRESFSYMDSRIDPPSSMHKLTIADIAEQCETGEVWSVGEPVLSCMMLKHKTNVLYIGKLAVSEKARGQGLGKQMINIAVDRANAHSKALLEVEVRVELVENHAFFNAMGFEKIAAKAHPGYTRPTYFVMQKEIGITPNR